MKKSVLMAAVLASTLLGTPIASRAASLVANIDVSSQTMTVSKYGQVLYRWSVSTARKGYFTPRGSYR
ncbi:MAG: L,D-transpeptidase, partial [Mesorhizobium sp.]